MTPEFAHAPMHGHWSMLAYGGGEPLEFNYFSPTSRTGIIRRARFEALWFKRDSVRVRDTAGEIIYDGPSGDMP